MTSAVWSVDRLSETTTSNDLSTRSSSRTRSSVWSSRSARLKVWMQTLRRGVMVSEGPREAPLVAVEVLVREIGRRQLQRALDGAHERARVRIERVLQLTARRARRRREPDALDRRLQAAERLLADARGDLGTRAVAHPVAVGDDAAAGLLHGGDHRRVVERRQRADVDDLHAHAAAREDVGGLHGLDVHPRGGDDGDVAAFAEDLARSITS